MGVFDKFLDIMKLNDDDYDDDFMMKKMNISTMRNLMKNLPVVLCSERKIRRKNLLMILIWKRKRNFSLLPQAR